MTPFDRWLLLQQCFARRPVPAAQAQEKVTLRYGQIANSARSVSSLRALRRRSARDSSPRRASISRSSACKGVQYQIEELDKGNVDVSHTATPYLIQAVLKGSRCGRRRRRVRPTTSTA